jgi:hypothetical protein
LVGGGKRPRSVTAGELASDDLFALPVAWEVMRVEPRRLTRQRHGIVAVAGFMYCRPKGSWETMRLPFLHVWTMSAGRALRFQNFLDGIEMERTGDAGR